MSVADEMLKIRRELVEEDRHDAMEAIVRLLHYKVAPRVASGDTFTLFADNEAAAKFCEEFHIDRRAFDWLLNAMREEGLLTPGKAQVVLTPLGVEKFCL